MGRGILSNGLSGLGKYQGRILLSVQRVNEGDILAGRFQCTRKRFAVTSEPALVLHDTTTQFSHDRGDDRAIGKLTRNHKSPAAPQCMRNTNAFEPRRDPRRIALGIVSSQILDGSVTPIILRPFYAIGGKLSRWENLTLDSASEFHVATGAPSDLDTLEW